MAKIYNWRIWCSTDSKWEYEWNKTEPTTCPVNGGHSIDAAKTSAVETIGDEAPATSDGKPIFLASTLPGSVDIAHAGIGDDIAAGTRWAGQAFELQESTATDKVIEFQFKEWIYLVGGELKYAGAVVGDYLTYEIYAPSSAPAETSNPGSGAYSKLDIGGGLNIYCTPGTPGAGAADWDLDIAVTLNGNVGFSKVVPIPSATGTGFFDWDADTEAVTGAPAGVGGYNLMDADFNLVVFIPKMRMLGEGLMMLTVPAAYKAKRIIAHWKHKVTFHNSTAKAVDVVWTLFMGRKVTRWV